MTQSAKNQPAASDLTASCAGEARRGRRIDRFLPAMACPDCGGDLRSQSSSVDCTACGAAYPIRRGRIYFCAPPPTNDSLDSVKRSLRRILGSAYPLLVGILGPTLLPNYHKVLGKYVDPSKKMVVDVGSGDRRVHPDTLCLDWNDHHEVDVVCKLPAFPFKPDSLDGITAWNVFEQLEAPQESAKKMILSLRADSYIMAEIPFMMPYHAGPEDHQRFTHQGAEGLFKPCLIVDQWNTAGPFSLFCFVIAELVPAMLAFGLPRLRAWIYLVLCALLSPLKYLDVISIRRRSLIGIAPSILTIGRKTDPKNGPGDLN